MSPNNVNDILSAKNRNNNIALILLKLLESQNQRELQPLHTNEQSADSCTSPASENEIADATQNLDQGNELDSEFEFESNSENEEEPDYQPEEEDEGDDDEDEEIYIKNTERLVIKNFKKLHAFFIRI